VANRSATPAILLAASLLAGCPTRDEPFDRGPANFDDPRAAPVSCPTPALASGGTDQAPDPGTTCVRTVQDSALDPVPGATYGWIDLGEHTVGEVVPFLVPGGTASVTILEQWVSGAADFVTVGSAGGVLIAPNTAVVGELRDAAGQLVYSDFHAQAPADGSDSLLFFDSPGGTVTYPDTTAGLAALDASGVAPGTWTAMVNDYAYECWLTTQPSPPPGLAGINCSASSQRNDGLYRVYALTKPAVAGSPSAIPETGTLDVAFHIVDAPTPVIGIDAAAAVSDPRVARMIESYAAHLAYAGLCLGTVTFSDAPDWARTRFATGISDSDVGPCSNLSQLVALSAPRARTLDMFLVPRINSALGTVVGLDPSVPGPVTVNGTVASGAVVSAEDLLAGTCPAPGSGPDLLRCGADVVGYIAAHEAGHFLGLYHTSESDGRTFDPLSDTPHCECNLYCFPSSGICTAGLPPGVCDQHYPRCSGGANLMFWAIDPAVSVGYLSPSQGQVVRASPLVRSP
jgi:hypothetical protein